MKKASEVLRSVRDRLSPVDDKGEPTALSRRFEAETAEGKPGVPLAPDTVRWGIVGAIYAVGKPREWDLTGAVDYLYRVIRHPLRIFMQDTPHKAILEKIDEAIEAAEKDGR